MKRIITILLILIILTSITACNNTQDTNLETQSETNNEMKIDIDVTNFSITILYPLVENMLFYPDDYMGKIVKIKGDFKYWEDEASKENVYMLVVSDEAQCCSAEIEIRFESDFDYSKLPNRGDEFTIIGRFDSDYKDGVYFSYIGDSILVSFCKNKKVLYYIFML